MSGHLLLFGDGETQQHSPRAGGLIETEKERDFGTYIGCLNREIITTSEKMGPAIH